MASKKSKRSKAPKSARPKSNTARPVSIKAAAPSAPAAPSIPSRPAPIPVTMPPSASALRARDWGLAVLTALLILLIYIPTLSVNVLLEDDGLLLGVGATLGIAHPPGYPLYTLGLWAFMQLPFATPALAGHAFSALLGALGAGALYLCARLLGLGLVAALVAAFAFGLQEHVWSQAIRADVYSLHYLLTFSVLALVLQVRRTPDRQGLWMAGALVTGLALANHWPLFVLIAPGLALLLWPVRAQALRHAIVFAGVSLATAALLYGWMVVRSWADPAFAYSGPIDSVAEFIRYLLREDFSGVDNKESAGWPDRLQYFGWFSWQAIIAFSLPGFAFIVFGFWQQWRRARLTALGLLLMWIGQGLFLFLMLNFDFDGLNVAVVRVYSLVGYGILALWLALGIQGAVTLVKPRLPTALGPYVPIGGVALIGLILLALFVPRAYRLADTSDFTFARDYATYVLNRVPPNSVIFVGGDFETAALGYHHYVEPVREDIELIHTNGIMYNNRRFSHLLPGEQKAAILRTFFAEETRPLYFLFLNSARVQCPDCGVVNEGLLVQAILDAPDDPMVRWTAEDQEFLDKLVAFDTQDRWGRVQRQFLLSDAGRMAGRVALNPDLGPNELAAVLDEPAAAPWVHSGAIRQTLETWDQTHLDRVSAWSAQSAAAIEAAVNRKQDWSRFYKQSGLVAFYQGREEEAVELLNRSVEAWASPQNESLDILRQLENR